MSSRTACTSSSSRLILLSRPISFAATAIITLGALWFIFKRMLAVRKKVIIGMRDDLRSRNIATSEPAANSGYTEADLDQRSWKNPFAKPAVTEPGQ